LGIETKLFEKQNEKGFSATPTEHFCGLENFSLQHKQGESGKNNGKH